MDWTIETSREFIRRQYSFNKGKPSSVIETIYWKLDSHGDYYAKPHLQSVKKYRLNVSNPTSKQADLLKHAQFLIHDFQKNRKEFKAINF
ncbi:MAG: hypothetical protein ABIP97_06045 [Chthoniobacterales bacterium]